MSYEIGSRIGDYEIIRILGAGGMGRVYQVRNNISDRIEAMKVLLPDLEGNAELADRFIREIKVQASLDHPNIAVLHTALRMDNQLLMLMEYVEGLTLAEIMQQDSVAVLKAVDYILQVLSALDYAHSQGVVHRDVKPANIMITPTDRVKLMDFGIAKMAIDSQITRTGSTLGSLYYMSPEQIKETKDVDHRSDLYSVAVTLYEAVTHVRPFQGDSGYSIMAAHLEGNPRPPIEISPNLPPRLSDTILRALEKEPSKRFQSAESFRSALLNVRIPEKNISTSATTLAFTPTRAEDAVKEAPASPPPVEARSRRALWIAVGSLLLIVVSVIAIQIPKMLHTTAENEPFPTPVTLPIEVFQVPESDPVRDSTGSPAPAAPLPEESPDLNQNAVKEMASSRDSLQTGQTNQPKSEMTPPKKVTNEPAAQLSDVSSKDPDTSEQIKDIRRQYNLLFNVRAAAIKSALDKMRNQKVAKGPRLRAEVANAVRLMNYHFAETDVALDRGDVPEAKRNLELAKGKVEQLERMLKIAARISKKPAAKQNLQ